MSKSTVVCQHGEAPNCLKTMERDKNAIKQNVKKNGKFICYPCTIWINKMKKLELEGTFLKECQETINYNDRKLCGEVTSCIVDEHEAICRLVFPVYPYSKDKVPIEDFINPKSKTPFKQCLGCRTYETQCRKYRKEVLISKDDESTGYKTCLYECHPSISQIPKDKVPIEKFLKNPNNPEGIKYEYCLECRKACADKYRALIIKRIKEKEETGKNFCITCTAAKNDDEMGVNRDGTTSPQCIHCKNSSNISSFNRYYELKQHYRDLQYNAMISNECSCKICNCIFIKPEGNTFTCIRLQVIQENEEKVVYYKNNRYLAKEFIQKFRDILEFRIMDFDHLPTDDPNMQKIDEVSVFWTKEGMTNESKKCQLIDCLCHVVVTIERERKKWGKPKYPEKIKQKREYVNNIKRRGCISCGFIPDENMLRFMHMDHIDPKMKLDNVSTMTTCSYYSLNEVIHECGKCKCSCAFCHRIRTSIQRENGEISGERYEYNGIDDFDECDYDEYDEYDEEF